MTKFNSDTILLISYAGKVMLKILLSSLQQYMNLELSDVQTGFRKGIETRDQIANIYWIIKKTRELQKKKKKKNNYICFIDYVKAFNCLIATNCGNLLKTWESQTS